MRETDRVPSMIDDRIINKKLKEFFGEQDGQANFRFAWTATQTEYRRNGLTGVVELVLRYNYLPRGYWAIEKLTPTSGVNQDALAGAKFSYEPIFVFRRPNSDEPMSCSQDAVMAIVHVHLFRQKPRRTKEQMEEAELARIEKEVDYFTQFLTDECSPLSTQLHFGEAAVVQGFRDNGRSDDCITGSVPNQGIQAADESGSNSDSGGT